MEWKPVKIEAYVINLKKRDDRLRMFLKQCPLQNVQREDAVNGKESGYILKRMYRNCLSPGEQGCFLSHINLWKKQVSREIDYFIIFEDDAIFSDDFVYIFDNIIFNLKKSITYIGGRFERNFKMQNKYCMKVNEYLVKEKKNKKEKYNALQYDRTTHAYIIHKDYAKLLLNSLKIKLFSFKPVDHYILKVLRFYNQDIYSSNPLICHSPFDNESDIR